MNRMLLGSLVAFGLAVTACSDDDTANDTDTTTPEATVAPTDPPASDPPTTDPATPTSPLDATFGVDGILASPQSATEADRFITVVQGPDGMIYASGFTSAGDDHMFAVSRFSADGTPDATFGDGGTAAINVTEGGGGGVEVARGLVVNDDGTVLISGPFEKDPTAEGDAAKDNDVAVIRLDASGALDATFGDGGIARIDIGAGKTIDAETYLADNAWGLTARDGGYAVFGVTPNQGADRTDVDYAIVGLTDTGAIDEGFGTDGFVIADIDASGDNARNINTAADGSVIATGYSRDGDGVVSPTLIKMSAQGVLDESFGNGGIANHIVLAGVTESYQWAAQGDNYVLAGYGRGADSEEKVDLVAYRFLADGNWDTSFGTDGVTRLDLAGQDDRARNLTILPNGNILLVGSGKLDADNIDGMVVMLDADGAFVESFGDGGHFLVDLGGPADGIFGVSVSTDGAFVYFAGFKGADPDGTDNDDAVLGRIAL